MILDETHETDIEVKETKEIIPDKESIRLREKEEKRPRA